MTNSCPVCGSYMTEWKAEEDYDEFYDVMVQLTGRFIMTENAIGPLAALPTLFVRNSGEKTTEGRLWFTPIPTRSFTTLQKAARTIGAITSSPPWKRHGSTGKGNACPQR